MVEMSWVEKLMVEKSNVEMFLFTYGGHQHGNTLRLGRKDHTRICIERYLLKLYSGQPQVYSRATLLESKASDFKDSGALGFPTL